MPSLHGIPTNADLNSTARHEAGHLLMLWLLDRQGVACGIADGCGLTKALDEPGAMETPHQRILYAMSGIVLGGDYGLFSDLRQHATEPDYFDPMSDSHHASEALPLVGGEPALMVSQYMHIILRLGNRFNTAHRQATKLLLEKQAITFDIIHGQFSQWDVEYGLAIQPNSDVVCRAIAKMFRWRLPHGKAHWLGL